MNFQTLLECHTNFKKLDIIQSINKSIDFIKLTSKSSINILKTQKRILLMVMRINLIGSTHQNSEES